MGPTINTQGATRRTLVWLGLPLRFRTYHYHPGLGLGAKPGLFFGGRGSCRLRSPDIHLKRNLGLEVDIGRDTGRSVGLWGQKKAAFALGARVLRNRRPSIERICRGGHILWDGFLGLSDFINRGTRYPHYGL